LADILIGNRGKGKDFRKFAKEGNVHNAKVKITD
jgi:hypothetical protein